MSDSSSNCSPQGGAENKGDSADLQAASTFRCKVAGNAYCPGNNASCTEMTTEVSPLGTEVHDASKGAFVSSGPVPQVRLQSLPLCTLIFSMLLCTSQESSLMTAEEQTCCTSVCPGSLMYVLLFGEAMVADRQPGLAPAAAGWHRLQGQAVLGWLPVCKPVSPHQGPPKQADHLCRP